MRKITTAFIALLAVMALAGCAPAQAMQEREADKGFASVQDTTHHEWPAWLGDNPADKLLGAIETARQARQKPAQQEIIPEPEPVADYGYSEPYSASYAPVDNGDGFRQQGVRNFNGRTETWYSSNQAYHYRTGEWTADDEGYYRDGDGNYVVAASDMPEGATFETSKGTAKVYDSGCENGVTDFYVNFG